MNALDLDRALALARDLDLVRALDRPLARDRALARDVARNLVLFLALDPTRIRERIPELASKLATNQVLASIRRKRWLFFHSRSKKSEEDMIQLQMESLRDIYVDLVVLEGRIQGKFPACEGILIVKERS